MPVVAATLPRPRGGLAVGGITVPFGMKGLLAPERTVTHPHTRTYRQLPSTA
jgi:hypothetical protein